MTNQVALIGAGVMGNAIGSRLCETGNHLRVYDRNEPRVAALVDKGANGASSAAEAAENADYIFTGTEPGKCRWLYRAEMGFDRF